MFVGETDSSKVLGLHNWIQFYLQEKSRKIDYRGYKGLIKVLSLEKNFLSLKIFFSLKVLEIFFQDVVAPWYNPLTLQPEQSGEVGSNPGRAPPLERHGKGSRTRLGTSHY